MAVVATSFRVGGVAWSSRISIACNCSPLHIGERGVGMERRRQPCHRILFSALCLALRELEGQGWLDDWLDAFIHGPAPFLITSTFPWAGDVRFYPRPMLNSLFRRLQRPSQHSRGKLLKKTAYTPESIFRRILAGQPLDGEWVEENILPGDCGSPLPERNRYRKTWT